MSILHSCIALSRNDNFSSAYLIAFEGESKRGRKQCDLAPKNTIHFVSKLIIFQEVGSDIDESWGQPRISTLTNFRNI